MHKTKIAMLFLLATILSVPIVNAGGTGTIRIDPVWPVMLGSPATFTIWVEGSGDPTHNPHVLLVMSKGCYDGLTGNVVVSWSWPSSGQVSFTKANFGAHAVSDNSAKVPDSGTTPGACYTVASLKDHLSYGLSVPISASETIYWVMGSFLGGADLTGTHRSFTVTFTSTDPRMLVYAIGKTEAGTLFDNKVPPTQPGFIVPELGTVLLVLASFSALALYALKRRKLA